MVVETQNDPNQLQVTLIRCQGLDEARRYYASVFIDRDEVGKTPATRNPTDSPAWLHRVSGPIAPGAESVVATVIVFATGGLFKKDTPVTQIQFPLGAADLHEALIVPLTYDALPLYGIPQGGKAGPPNGTLDLSFRTSFEPEEKRIDPPPHPAVPYGTASLEINLLSARGLTHNRKVYTENSLPIDAYAVVTASYGVVGEDPLSEMRRKTRRIRVKPRDSDHDWDARFSLPFPWENVHPDADGQGGGATGGNIAASLTLQVDIIERLARPQGSSGESEERQIGWSQVVYTGSKMQGTLEVPLKRRIPIKDPGPSRRRGGGTPENTPAPLGTFGHLFLILRCSLEDVETSGLTDTDRCLENGGGGSDSNATSPPVDDAEQLEEEEEVEEEEEGGADGATTAGDIPNPHPPGWGGEGVAEDGAWGGDSDAGGISRRGSSAAPTEVLCGDTPAPQPEPQPAEEEGLPGEGVGCAEGEEEEGGAIGAAQPSSSSPSPSPEGAVPESPSSARSVGHSNASSSSSSSSTGSSTAPPPSGASRGPSAVGSVTRGGGGGGGGSIGARRDSKRGVPPEVVSKPLRGGYRGVGDFFSRAMGGGGGGGGSGSSGGRSLFAQTALERVQVDNLSRPAAAPRGRAMRSGAASAAALPPQLPLSVSASRRQAGVTRRAQVPGAGRMQPLVI